MKRKCPDASPTSSQQPTHPTDETTNEPPTPVLPTQPLPAGNFRIEWSCSTTTEPPIVSEHHAKLVFTPENSSRDVEAGSLVAFKFHMDGRYSDTYLETLDEMSGDIFAVGQLIKALEASNIASEALEVDVPTFLPEYIHALLPPDVHVPTVRLVNHVAPAYEITNCAVLYVDEIKVALAFRKCGLGLFLLDQADAVLNDCSSLCVLSTFPLQFVRPNLADMPWTDFDDDATIPPKIAAAKAAYDAKFDSACSKIDQHFMRLGFRRLELGDAKYLGRWNGHVHPKATDVVPQLA
ncbi:Aste57867_1479 [Aphanomyces stellatus]|uniref:Aste57867_1479 protein n=1 Tax=Aphanomyces stellatus TaxID=120398 RepID=A0A485K9H9_9STRA|nr:hypothetical protein As57867_001478 [Aphanomyces stellatus]VFT78695.1 Aste57867_1479 [Aphanomyces stellatus]